MKKLQRNSVMLWVAVLAVMLPFLSCAQSRPVIKKIYAFYIERQPGNIAVDPKTGEPFSSGIDTVTIVYIETTTKFISWDTAWQKGKCYLVNAVVIPDTAFEAGIRKWDNKKIIITKKAGNFLWQLRFQPVKTKQHFTKKMEESEIIIKGKYRGKIIIRKVASPVELAVPPAV